MYDVVIIGAGVSGSACARELSKYNLSICVVEKEEDVCCGTSKANSAIIHSGIDCKTGTLMAQMNLRGNEMMDIRYTGARAMSGLSHITITIVCQRIAITIMFSSRR